MRRFPAQVQSGLSNTLKQLSQEHDEYAKYNGRLKSEISEMMAANERLLLTWQRRAAEYSQLQTRQEEICELIPQTSRVLSFKRLTPLLKAEIEKAASNAQEELQQLVQFARELRRGSADPSIDDLQCRIMSITEQIRAARRRNRRLLRSLQLSDDDAALAQASAEHSNLTQAVRLDGCLWIEAESTEAFRPKFYGEDLLNILRISLDDPARVTWLDLGESDPRPPDLHDSRPQPGPETGRHSLAADRHLSADHSSARPDESFSSKRDHSASQPPSDVPVKAALADDASAGSVTFHCSSEEGDHAPADEAGQHLSAEGDPPDQGSSADAKAALELNPRGQESGRRSRVRQPRKPLGGDSGSGGSEGTSPRRLTREKAFPWLPSPKGPGGKKVFSSLLESTSSDPGRLDAALVLHSVAIGPSKRDLMSELSRIEHQTSQITRIGELEKAMFDTDWEFIQLRARMDRELLLRRQRLFRLSQSSLTVLFSSDKIGLTRLWTTNEIGVETEHHVEDIEKVRMQIRHNNRKPARAYLLGQEATELELELTQKRAELQFLQIAHRQLCLDAQRLMRRLSFVDPVAHRSGVPGSDMELDAKLTAIQDKRMVRLAKLEECLGEGAVTFVDVQNQIRDIEFVILQYQRELIEKTHEVKANVRSLVGIRKSHRDIIHSLAREFAFIQVETTEIESGILEFSAAFAPEVNARVHEKNDALHSGLMHLKSRFRSHRAVTEGHAITLTSEEDMKLLHSEIRTLLSDIEVCKMRKSALQAKIVKQIRRLEENTVRVPDPLTSLDRQPLSKTRSTKIDQRRSLWHVP